MALYRSPYEAYPFLCDADDDLRCDFELATDELASAVGMLRSQTEDQELAKELLWICELLSKRLHRPSFTSEGKGAGEAFV